MQYHYSFYWVDEEKKIAVYEKTPIQTDNAFDRDYKNKICSLCGNKEDLIYSFSKFHKECRQAVIDRALNRLL